MARLNKAHTPTETTYNRHRERKTEDPEIRTHLLQATPGRTFVQYLDLILHGPIHVLPKRITQTSNIIAIPLNK